MAEGATEGLQRPYTVGTFQTKLNEFQELMKDITLQDVEATPEERRQMITENLRFDQFCDTLKELFGSDIKNQDLKALYRKISTNPDAKVDWSELFGYIQTSAEEKEEVMVGEEVSVFTVSKRRRVGEAAGDKKRRDTVQSIRFVPSLDCYITCSQKGTIAVWTSKLRLQGCVDINEIAWVTGCDYLPNIRRVACCTERSINIWDNRSKGKNQHIFSIKPFDHSPQCMTVLPRSYSTLEDIILFGDDQGYMNVLTVAAKDLTMKNSKGGEKRQSKDQNFVHVIEPPKLTQEVRWVSIPKGVNAFDYCIKANIIATGGVDKVIRVWHPHIFSRPTGKLLGHLFTIVDICCNERDQHIISLSTARVFRVWDIHTLTSLQVFTDNEERPGERRIYSMIFDNKHERLLTGSSVIDAWPLTRAVQDTMQVPHTHDRPISQILFNKDLGQIITVCTESVLKVWEMDTGKLVYTIPECHGTNIEVTAVTLDSSGYRLATGAFNGSIRIWDFGSGQLIKKRDGRPTDEDLSISGLVYSFLESDRVLIASGWNNKIRIFLDTNENYDLPVIREFKDVYYYGTKLTGDPFRTTPLPDIGESISPMPTSRGASQLSHHSEDMPGIMKKPNIFASHDVTCVFYFPPNQLYTGCRNGDVLLWNIEKSYIDDIFELTESDEIINTMRDADDEPPKVGTDKKINMLKILTHRVRKLDPAFIRKQIVFQQTEKEEDKEKDSKPEEESKTDGEVRSQTQRTRLESRASQILKTKSTVGKETDSKMESNTVVEEPQQQQQQQMFEDKEISEDKDENRNKKEEKNKEIDEENERDKVDVEAEEGKSDDKKFIIETYDPILVTVHQDSYIRFWDMKGYLTLWDIGKFLENPESEQEDLIKQVICWRAHLSRIVTLSYIDHLKCIVSGSLDGSARLWWGMNGRFLGFFGQHRPFNFSTSEEKAGPPTLPYDITEGPLLPTKSVSAKQKIRPVKKYEYPLKFDEKKTDYDNHVDN
ncbi:hypothetical protein ACJMK2_037280 [Sinanodonta woodiana]|uniref:WD repeat-containing protein on Y chromosome n=1 Tax=Sinanodonta woodiana TaxID=1069815 RepID=A0ABD3WNC2_SINWO